MTALASSSTFTLSVLLQTATVWAYEQHDCVLVQILFDTGSQRIFVHSDRSWLLALSYSETDGLEVFTFGSSNCLRQYECRKAAITLRSHFQSSAVTLEALEVSEVCTVKGSHLDALHRSDASQPQLTSRLKKDNFRH